MDKLRMQSLDGVQDNIQKIGALFPECVTEATGADGAVTRKIDFEKLRQLLSGSVVEGREERYQFTWPDKKRAVLLANAPVSATLRPCREESVDFDTTQNLYIEGDNLDVLKCLKETYLHRVKMIYIDTPYNTGNDFVYEDDFAESAGEYRARSGQYDDQGRRLVANTESNGRFHTDWLNMIYPRLKVARDLLSDDGVIFISIDDNEVENLRKVCDEIFGENNFIGQWNWYKSATPPNLSKKIKKNIEYILVYHKGGNNNVFRGVQKTSASDDPITKPQNNFKELTFEPGWIKAKFPDGTIKAGVYGTDKFPNTLLNDMIVENGVNKNAVTFCNRFIWLQDTLNEQIKNGTKINLSKSLVISYKKAAYNAEVPPNLIDEKVGVETTEKAGAALTAMFDGVKIFDYPKPTSLLQYLIGFDDKDDSIILDFFSGSATTAHAVMQLNAEDGGNRKFILVQLPEATDEKSEARKAGYKNICEIGKERIRRAGAKIKQSTIKDEQPNLFDAESDGAASNIVHSALNIEHSLDTGFRVLKLDSSNMREVYYSPAETEQGDLFAMVDNVKDDRTGEDLLFQTMLELGATLDSKIETLEIGGKTVYNVAETKGSMSSMDLREIERGKIACAEKLFGQMSSDNVKYGKVDSYDKLMEIVK